MLKFELKSHFASLVFLKETWNEADLQCMYGQVSILLNNATFDLLGAIRVYVYADVRIV